MLNSSNKQFIELIQKVVLSGSINHFISQFPVIDQIHFVTISLCVVSMTLGNKIFKVQVFHFSQV